LTLLKNAIPQNYNSSITKAKPVLEMQAIESPLLYSKTSCGHLEYLENEKKMSVDKKKHQL
jgi:hypothetical protein